MSVQVVPRRMRGFISLTAHPAGCARNVADQIEVVRRGVPGEPARLGTVLVLGSSTGYGLASALVAAFGYGAPTLGVCFEKEPEGDKTATAGWYNLAAAHDAAAAAGLHFETINGDAFSDDVKRSAISALAERFSPVDLVVYSVAAPRRRGADGETWSSVLKPIGAPYTGRGFDLRNRTVTQMSIEPATDAEIADTVKVMGGEDWAAWIEVLDDAGLLAPGCRTVAYSYIGPEVTAAIYRNGTIGEAKKHLEATAHDLDARLAARDVSVAPTARRAGAWVSVNKAVVTQASSAIPAVPLYLSMLTPVLAASGEDESAIEQIVRLFVDHLGPGVTPRVDDARRIRLDDREMAPAVQDEIARRWAAVTTDDLASYADVDSYFRAFNQLFGFDVDGVDESAPVEIDIALPT